MNFSMANYGIGTAGHSIELTEQVNLPAAYKATVQNIKVMACSAVDLLTKPEELEKVKADFEKIMEGRTYDPGEKTMLDFKYFGEPPGVTPTLPNKLAFNPSETMFDEKNGTVINVYLNEEKVGNTTIKDPQKAYTVTTTKEFKDGDILVVKYQNKDGAEIVYGYVKKF